MPFYHCFGMVMGNLGATTPRRLHRHPGTGIRPGRALRRSGRAVYESLWRADDVHRRAGPPRLRQLRPVVAAHRDHGRVAVPGRGDERVVSDMHMEEVTICYGMTETSPVSTQTGADDDLRASGRHGRPGHPHVEVKVVDPLTGRTVRGQAGEFCTRGYPVMLGYWDEPERRPRPSTPTVGCTPATWPRWTTRAT